MVGLLTLDSKIYNYGGFLQEMALQDAIKELGYECEIIDYDINQEVYTFSLKRGLKNLSYRKIKNKFLKRKELAISEEVAAAIAMRKHAIDLYRDSNLYLSKKIIRAELYNLTSKYNQLVCGSDQIWNPDYNIPSFFLNFGTSECNKIIYAASIGRNYLTRHEKNVYEKYLKYPDYISVREKSAQSIISKLTEKTIELVLDPTLLHTKKYWLEKANNSSFEYKDYIFCYFLNLTDEKIKAACDFAKKNKYTIITIPYLHNRYENDSERLCGKMLSNVNPADFLKLIMDADVILTDSFHATVFSIMFEKDFWCFKRDVGMYNMNTRLHTLLEYVSLEERMIEVSDLKNKVCMKNTKISFKKLDEQRQYSRKFLKDALSLN